LLFGLTMGLLHYFQKRDRSLLGASEGAFADGVIGSEAKPDRLERFFIQKLTTLRRAVGQKAPAGASRRDCESCQHQTSSCVEHCGLGLARGFTIGFILKVALTLLPGMAGLLNAKRRAVLLQRSFGRSSLKMGLFLGLLSAGTRASQCLIRRIRGQEDGWNHFLSGFIGGLAFNFSQSTELCMYFASKAIDVVYKFLKKSGIVKPIPFFQTFLFSISTAFIITTTIWEPQNVRPSYLNYLAKATGGYFVDIVGGLHNVRLATASPVVRDVYLDWYLKVFTRKYKAVHA